MSGRALVRSCAAIAIAIGVLYLTIWPHELGHAIVAHAYGCKPTWWQTDMSWFLWGSWGGDIDYACLARRGRAAQLSTDLAGSIANLFLIGAAAVVGQWWRRDERPRSRRGWLVVATVFWALGNYAEAFSYLVLNTAWLKSDMLTVVTASGVSQWIWFALGLAAAIAVGRLLSPMVRRAAAVLESRSWIALQVVYVAIVAAAMAAARATLT